MMLDVFISTSTLMLKSGILHVILEPLKGLCCFERRLYEGMSAGEREPVTET